MKLNICTTYDSKAKCYTVPALIPSTQSIDRVWADAVNDPNSVFNKHPEDYTLFHIGEFDFESGKLTNYEAKISIGTALHFKQ